MKRAAIFVEGLTEQILSAAIVHAIASAAQVEVQFAYQFQNRIIFSAGAPNPATTHFVLIVDCGGDAQVKTQIRDNYTSLQQAGYEFIIGLRDVYPLAPTDVPQIEAFLQAGLPVGPTPIYMHLAIMEVEAWLLAEKTHFARIHKKLTPAFVAANGIDLAAVPPQQWNNPAEILNNVYQLVGMRYKKKRKSIERTIAAISIAEITSPDLRALVPELGRFLESLEKALDL